MDKRWAHCKVGIAGALPLLHRFGSNPRQGTLICPKCKATNLLVLHADGCNRCHKPEKIDPQSYAGNYLPRTEPFEQLPETLVLKARVDELMKWKGMKHFSTFAKTIGVLFDRRRCQFRRAIQLPLRPFAFGRMILISRVGLSRFDYLGDLIAPQSKNSEPHIHHHRVILRFEQLPTQFISVLEDHPLRRRRPANRHRQYHHQCPRTSHNHLL